MIQKGSKAQKGSAAVSLNKNVVICRLRGEITGAIVHESMRQTNQLAEQARLQGPPRLLLDVSKVTKQDSEARSRAKALNQMGFERIAVTGGSRAITTMGRYIARAAGMGAYTKFFRREADGWAWLEHEYVPASDNMRGLRLVGALLLAILAVATLVGWALDVPVLRSVIPDLKPMNQAGAVTVLAWALCLLAMGPKWREQRWRHNIVIGAAVWSIAAGAAVGISFIEGTHVLWLENVRQ